MSKATDSIQDRIQEIQRMVSGIPGSAFAESKAKGTPVMDLDTWKALIANKKDQGRIYRAHAQLGLGRLGPQTEMAMTCPCAVMHEWETLINWQALSSFLFDPVDTV